MAKHFSNEKKASFKPFKFNLRSAVIIVLILVMAFSGYKVLSGVIKYKAGEKFDEDLQTEIVEVVKKDPVSSKPSNVISGDPNDRGGMEEYEVELKINFNRLKEKNSDTIGYIYSDGTPINYPIVQGYDNQHYVTHRFDGAYSSFGTIFADYRQAGDFSENYTVLYGHNMDNGSMFAELLKYRTQDYYDNHKEMLIHTSDKKYTLSIFSGYVASVEDFCYTAIDEYVDMGSLIDYAKSCSYFESDVEVSSDDKIVLLSTCAYDFKNARFIVFGKLTEITE